MTPVAKCSSYPRDQSLANQHPESTMHTSCMCRPCDNHEILLSSLQNKQTFHMFSLRDLRFVLCSRDLDVLRAQRIRLFSYLNYPQINEVWNSDHVVVNGGEWHVPLILCRALNRALSKERFLHLFIVSCPLYKPAGRLLLLQARV